ncbi:OLC1v1037977C1 [Oldenlandia corymbosa var. corymbosa]|uniref:OLC1v1037977C1 n=1 Tax=Oldenlandia corymbosa var. corymbosa TaxID=529605 RepID=A0AAV1CZN4_OLDCO|nr:OLC1v1037977C1 [Oldenlandia corymbosa var. corymbosa]
MWLSRIDELFDDYQMSSEDQLLVASFYSAGEPLQFYYGLKRASQLDNWEKFIGQLALRFGDYIRPTTVVHIWESTPEKSAVEKETTPAVEESAETFQESGGDMAVKSETTSDESVWEAYDLESFKDINQEVEKDLALLDNNLEKSDDELSVVDSFDEKCEVAVIDNVPASINSENVRVVTCWNDSVRINRLFAQRSCWCFFMIDPGGLGCSFCVKCSTGMGMCLVSEKRMYSLKTCEVWTEVVTCFRGGTEIYLVPSDSNRLLVKGEILSLVGVNCSLGLDKCRNDVDKSELEKWLFLIDHSKLQHVFSINCALEGMWVLGSHWWTERLGKVMGHCDIGSYRWHSRLEKKNPLGVYAHYELLPWGYSSTNGLISEVLGYQLPNFLFHLLDLMLFMLLVWASIKDGAGMRLVFSKTHFNRGDSVHVHKLLISAPFSSVTHQFRNIEGERAWDWNFPWQISMEDGINSLRATCSTSRITLQAASGMSECLHLVWDKIITSLKEAQFSTMSCTTTIVKKEINLTSTNSSNYFFCQACFREDDLS